MVSMLNPHQLVSPTVYNIYLSEEEIEKIYNLNIDEKMVLD